ncbi:hypothetical protein [Bacillus sp. FSL R10-2780]|uniref:hypothetical protein n=1 Tax=Bacillus sp. FSL R10-2780 TaxID=2954660 RepID=UPI0030F96C11
MVSTTLFVIWLFSIEEDGALYAMKVARTVLSGGKDGDNFKVLPIATVARFKSKKSSVYWSEALL